MAWISQILHGGFAQAVLKESDAPPENPGRGWYHIYTFEIGSGKTPLSPVRYEGESLALLLFDIGCFREGALGQEALEEMRGILSVFAGAGLDLIVRVTYDTQGNGIGREPNDVSVVIRHMGQIGPVLKQFADSVFVYQGLFVGNWGEMHGSKFLSKNYLKRLYQAFREAVGEGFPIAIRRPVQYRMLFSQDLETEALGFFDDALFSNEIHLGTFAVRGQGTDAWEDMWEREREIAFETPMAGRVPFGGEALMGDECDGAQEVLSLFRTFQISYLNSVHEERCLEAWKQTPYMQEGGKEGTLYDYIASHLGYRLLITGIAREKNRPQQTGKSGKYQWKVTLKNDGFAPCYRDLEIALYRRGASALEEMSGGKGPEASEIIGDGPIAVLTIPGKSLKPGEEKSFFLCPEEELRDQDRLYLGAREQKSRKIVRFSQICEGQERPEAVLFIGRAKA